MWVMLPIVGGAAIAKRITKNNNNSSKNTTSSNDESIQKFENHEDVFSKHSKNNNNDNDNNDMDEYNYDDYDDDYDYDDRFVDNNNNNNNNNNSNSNNTKHKMLSFLKSPHRQQRQQQKASIEQFLPSINVEQMLEKLKQEKFQLECELGMMNATLEEEAMRADALEEDLNNTRVTLQAVIERDSLDEAARANEKLRATREELILMNETLEEEFKKNDELKSDLQRVQKTLDEVVKREIQTVRENEDLLRRSKFEINEELMISNEKMERLERERFKFERQCESYEKRIEMAKMEFEETLKKYSEANKHNIEKIEGEHKVVVGQLKQELKETKDDLRESLIVIDELQREEANKNKNNENNNISKSSAAAGAGDKSFDKLIALQQERESEHALEVADLAESLEEKDDEIKALINEISVSRSREESLREKVVSLSSEKVKRVSAVVARSPRGKEEATDSFDDFSIDEEVLKAESSKVAYSTSKAESSVSPRKRFGGLFGGGGRNNNINKAETQNRSPLSEFAKDASETLLSPPISTATPPTPPNFAGTSGNSSSKRLNVKPSEMRAMQQQVQELVAKVDGATTPLGISKALKELEELQIKLASLDFAIESPTEDDGRFGENTPRNIISYDQRSTPTTTTSTSGFTVNMSPSPPRSTRRENKNETPPQQSLANAYGGEENQLQLEQTASFSTPGPSSINYSSNNDNSLPAPWLSKSPSGRTKQLKKCTSCQIGFPESDKQFCAHCLTPPNKRGSHENSTTPPVEAVEKKKKKLMSMSIFKKSPVKSTS
jgi:hypothetical protein